MNAYKSPANPIAELINDFPFNWGRNIIDPIRPVNQTVFTLNIEKGLGQRTWVARATDDPVGVLLNDVVNLDLTRQHINYAKDEMQQGGKVLLLRIGTVVTDQISGAITLGDPAHFMGAGQLCSATANSNSPVIGRWLSKKDADGFAKVAINIV